VDAFPSDIPTSNPFLTLSVPLMIVVHYFPRHYDFVDEAVTHILISS